MMDGCMIFVHLAIKSSKNADKSDSEGTQGLFHPNSDRCDHLTRIRAVIQFLYLEKIKTYSASPFSTSG
ncbi:hypothetical protein EYC80_004258 [Monilinia laxa]|uniref:Uncharacterized protein n=1 Tax=Monilinia laxa TaxID=61186 RepID=A0A5N6KM73_MONLA|nr:hypothetical protein EYC80_004258 [Monilinia laxa]